MSGKQEFTRSEIARQRRAHRAKQKLAQTSKRASTPILKKTARAAVDRKRFANQRRFNIALGLPEIHLHPSRVADQRTHASWRFISIAIAALISIAMYLVLSLPYFHVPSVTALGNNHLTREEIESALGVLGQSIFTVQPEESESRLRLTYPELLSAQVKVYLPNHVYVTVQERQPVIAWQQDEGYTWVDSSGVAFRPRGLVTGLVPVIGLTIPPVGMPVLDDPFSPPPYMQKELVEAILALAPIVPSDTTMVFDRSFGLGWKDSRGWDSFFGATAQDMPLKVRVYQSLVDSLTRRGIIPSFISVMYPDAPFYRTVKVDLQNLPVASGQE